MIKLFLIHCGFYDSFDGLKIFESHTNFFLAAENENQARSLVKEKKIFKEKRMHIDGIIHIKSVDGFDVILQKNDKATEELIPFQFRDLAPTVNKKD